MADETQVNSNPATTSKAPEAAPASTPSATPPSSPEAQKKSNAVFIVALVVFGLLIVGAVIFVAGGYSLQQRNPVPTPSVIQVNQDTPAPEPTEEEETALPTVEVTESALPTTSQQTTPTTGQTQVTPTVTQ